MSENEALTLAFMFGLFYNWLITRWGKSKYGSGFIAAWVAIGFLLTLIISTFVTEPSIIRLRLYWFGDLLVLTNQQHAAFYELKFFIAAGIPMFFGSLWRYLNTKII